MKLKSLLLSITLFAVIVLISTQKAFAEISINLTFPTNEEKCEFNIEALRWEIINPNSDDYDKIVINVYIENFSDNLDKIISKELPVDAEFYEFEDDELTILRTQLRTNYYWEVVVYDTSNNTIYSSQQFSFQLTKQPEFSDKSIEDFAACVSLTPILHWSNEENFAKHYTVQLSYYPNDFDSPANENIVITHLTDSSARVTINGTLNLDENTTFYWRIIDTACPDNYSATREFTTTTASPITLLTPANNAIGEAVLNSIITEGYGYANYIQLTWEDATQANNTYNLQIAADDSFTDIAIETDITNDTPYFNFEYNENNQKYYWRVLIANDDGACDLWSDVFSFTTPLQDVVPLSPSDVAECVPFDATFTWEKQENAPHYQLRISTNALFPNDNRTFYVNVVEDTNSVVVPLTNENTKYFWSIRMLNEETGNMSIWSDTLSFKTTLRGPQLLSPANGSMGALAGSTFRLTWQLLAITQCNYEIQVAQAADFSINSMLVIVLISDADRNTYDFSLVENENVSDYYWRVKAYPINEYEYCPSDWSQTFSFSIRTSAPSIIKPGVAYNSTASIDTIYSTSTIFKWTRPNNAQRYDIEYSLSIDALNNNDYAHLEYKYNYSIDSLQVDYLEADTIYYWRVRAKNGNAASDWSEIFHFRTGFHEPLVVTLSSPINNSAFVPSNAELKWRENILAQKFEIVVATANNFDDEEKIVTNVTTNTNDTIYTFAKDILSHSTQYFWRVRAINENVEGPWSAVWNFTTSPAAPSEAVALVTPLDDVSDISPNNARFTWNALNVAQYYILQISKAENFSTTVVNQNVVNRTFYIAENLEGETTYYWRVLAGNLNGDGSRWSEVRKFKTGTSSIVDLDYTSFINIAPNPVNVSTFHCNIGLKRAANLTLLIFDVLGNEVQSMNIDCLEGTNSLVLGTGQLLAGNYFCKVIADGKIIATTQFIVIK